MLNFSKSYLIFFLNLEKGLGAMLREVFVIGAESESVMMRWAWRLLSVYTGIFRFFYMSNGKVKLF